MAKITIGYVGGGATAFNGDADEFIAFMKDTSTQAQMIHANKQRTLVVKDKICFVEFSEEWQQTQAE